MFLFIAHMQYLKRWFPVCLKNVYFVKLHTADKEMHVCVVKIHNKLNFTYETEVLHATANEFTL